MTHRARAADGLALVPAVALPLIFLHARYQPGTTLGPVGVLGSDVAVLVVVLAALTAGLLYGWAPLVPSWPLWLASSALLLLFGVSVFWRPFEETTSTS